MNPQSQPRVPRDQSGQTLMEILAVMGFCILLLSGLLPPLKQSIDLSRPIQHTSEDLQFLGQLEPLFRQADRNTLRLIEQKPPASTGNSTGASPSDIPPAILRLVVPPEKEAISLRLPEGTRGQLTTNTTCTTFLLHRNQTQIGRLLQCD